jgi:hypothetical protein
LLNFAFVVDKNLFWGYSDYEGWTEKVTKNPIAYNLLTDEELRSYSNNNKVGKYFVPTVSNLSQSSKEGHYKFYTIQNALYINLDGSNYRVIDLKLSSPSLVESIEGKLPSRNILVKYLKTHSDETATGSCIACRASAAENMVMDIARRKIRTNISLEGVGGIQKPLTNAKEDAQKARNKLKVPFKDEYEEEKPDEKRSLWHGLFKEIAPNLLQVGCLLTLIFCVLGAIVSPFMPFIICGCVIGACFSNYVVDFLEKVVTFVPKLIKKTWIETKFLIACWKYDRDCKDFWGSRTADPRKIRKARKMAKKAYIKEVKEREALEKEADKKVRKATREGRIEAFKTVFLPVKYSKKKTLYNAKRGHYTDDSNTLGL